MRHLLVFVLIFSLFSFVSAQENTHICPMHPHINGGANDDCPICGMKLVNSPNSKEKNQGSGLHLHKHQQQSLGIKTGKVKRQLFGETIRAFGVISTNTRLEIALDIHTTGRIVDLPVNVVGDKVKKGDLLFTFYSPQLMTAQSDFLLGSQKGLSDQGLRLLGMDDKSISELVRNNQYFDGTPFYAQSDGVVTELSVRKGSHVNRGESVMKIQDFSSLWVLVDVPLRKIQLLSVGTQAKVSLPETGETIEGSIDYIHPVANSIKRTVEVRLTIKNTDKNKKPGTYVDVTFQTKIKPRLAVAEQAVIYGSRGAHVFIHYDDGGYHPKQIVTGITAGGFTEVIHGLTAGEDIVTSGQFMLDAETNLRGMPLEQNQEQSTPGRDATVGDANHGEH